MNPAYSIRDGIAIITLDNPPVNGLGHALRKDIVEGLDRAAIDAQVKAVVLIGAGNAFSGGADIREFNTPLALAEPNLRQVIARVESSAKPVIAAIHKVAMGGGLELALGCHYRVAAPGAQLALPEVKLGILPGAGGTQRLPRAIDVPNALEMILSGNPVPSQKGHTLGLVDAMIDGDLLEGAVTFAQRVVAESKPLRKLRDERAQLEGDAGAFFAAAKQKVAKESRGFPAPAKIIECVEAAVTLPFDEGVVVERSRYEQLLGSVESKAMRHAFFAERAAAKIPDVADDTPTADIRNVAIIGAGTMGGGIAMAFANAGIAVKLVEAQQDALDRGLGNIRKNYAATVSKGRLSQEEMDKRMALIRPTLAFDEIADCDMAIEAVFERMDVKQDIFRKLDATMKPGAILATNTSTLDVNAIAAATKRPESVIGTHFFSPANVMRLLEIVRGAKTAKPVLATAMQLSKKIRKVGVVSGVCDGFIGNRMLEKYVQQSLFLLDEGATPQQVDRALTQWGLAMGPFAMYDMAGNDIGYEIRKRRAIEHPGMVYSKLADRICELGRFGQKTGKGWYRYETGSRAPLPDPEVEQIMAEHRKTLGLAPRAISDEEIVERCMFALVNEGARILEEGIAARASDIDIVYLTGYGFPLYRGGPMFYADTVGLGNVAAAMNRYAKGYHGECWQPAPLLAKLAKEGRTFNGGKA